MGEIEKLSSQEKELEESIAILAETFKRLQEEERSLLNQAATHRKQWVSCRNFASLIAIYQFLCPRMFLFPNGTCVV